jgi:Flp pilus assembly protein TadD
MNLALKSALLGTLIALSVLNHAQAQGLDYLRQAEEAASRGEGLVAIQLFQSAIIHSPSAPEPYIGIAAYYAGNDQAALAEKYFGIALEMDPANPTVLKALALLALSRGDVADAEARHQILVEACAPVCPEEAQIRGAISAHAAAAMAGD